MASLHSWPLLLSLSAYTLLFVPTCNSDGSANGGNAPFTLSLSSNALMLSPGQTVDVTVKLHTTDTLSAPVIMSLGSPDNQPRPQGLNAAFDPPAVSPTPMQDATTTLHVLAVMPLQNPSYPLSVYAQSGGEQANAPLSVTVVGNSANWHRQIQTPGTTQVLALTPDGSGGTYVAANTTDSFAGFTNQGDFDGYLLHYRSDGALDFATPFATTGSDIPTALATDANGNIYVAGFTYGTFPGQVSTGSADAFLAKVSSTGALIRLTQFGTAGVEQLTTMALDPIGGVYVGGLTSGAFLGQSNAGGFDVFVAHFLPYGTLDWVTEFGTNQDERTNGVPNEAGVGLTLDTSGNLYVCGSTQGAFPGNTSLGKGDAFLAHVMSAGALSWVKQYGSSLDDALLSIAAHSNGQFYTAGWTLGSFDGQQPSGGQDAVVAAFKSDGTLAMTRQFGTSYADVANALTISQDQLYVIGTTRGSFPGQMQAGIMDIYFTRMNPDGSTVWLRQIGTSQADSGTTIIGTGSNLYIGGTTFGSFNTNAILSQSAGIVFQYMNQ